MKITHPDTDVRMPQGTAAFRELMSLAHRGGSLVCAFSNVFPVLRGVHENRRMAAELRQGLAGRGKLVTELHAGLCWAGLPELPTEQLGCWFRLPSTIEPPANQCHRSER